MTLVEMAQYFADHAASDLKQAQTIARSDRSGHALATAMYLAQQSIEKQIKSVAINMDKKMKLGKSESITMSLGHKLYPKLSEIYSGQIANLDAPPILPDWFHIEYGDQEAKNMAIVGRIFGAISEFWTLHSNDATLESLLWQNSMGVTLKECDLVSLNSKESLYLQKFLDIIGKSDHKISQRVNNGHMQQPMLAVIMDNDLLATYCDEYANSDGNVTEHRKLTQTFDNPRFFSAHFPNLWRNSFRQNFGSKYCFFFLRTNIDLSAISIHASILQPQIWALSYEA